MLADVVANKVRLPRWLDRADVRQHVLLRYFKDPPRLDTARPARQQAAFVKRRMVWEAWKFVERECRNRLPSDGGLGSAAGRRVNDPAKLAEWRDSADRALPRLRRKAGLRV